MTKEIHAAQSYLNYRRKPDVPIGDMVGPTTYRSPMFVVGEPIWDEKAQLWALPMSAVKPT